jgi:hypothetical protein
MPQVVYNAADPAGNVATCSFTVTVVDVEAPRITCPSAVVQFTDTGLATGRAEWAAPNVTDNSGRFVSVSGSAVSGTTVFLLGLSDVTFTATDLAGNTASCTFVVTILGARGCACCVEPLCRLLSFFLSSSFLVLFLLFRL